MHYDKVPALDFQDFLAGGAKKSDFVKALGEAYQNIGFVTIYNHNFDNELTSKLFDVYKQFFALPIEIKNRYQGTLGQRGYVPKGVEKAKGFKEPDLKEFFHVGQEVQGSEHIDYPENVWPKEIENFKAINSQSYRTLENIGFSVLEAIALFLELPQDFFREKVYNGNSVLRGIHYFPRKENDPSEAVRAAEHTDINLITVLMSANSEGLQVKRRDGEWIDVKPDRNSIIVNVGDMLSRITNNSLMSTVHRVVDPPQSKKHLPRYSIPFFMHPKPNIILSCLSSCINQPNDRLYESITAGDFLQQRLCENGLK